MAVHYIRFYRLNKFSGSKCITIHNPPGPIFGHVGDGNFHCALLFDPEKPEEYAACKATASRLANRAIARGGTCTGEHGIGVGKRAHLEAQFGPTGIAVMRSIKGALDPRGIMNPGKILN